MVGHDARLGQKNLDATIDAVLLPFKLPMKISEDRQGKSDLKKLMNAISSDEVMEVDDAYFRRITRLLRR